MIEGKFEFKLVLLKFGMNSKQLLDNQKVRFKQELNQFTDRDLQETVTPRGQMKAQRNSANRMLQENNDFNQRSSLQDTSQRQSGFNRQGTYSSQNVKGEKNKDSQFMDYRKKSQFYQEPTIDIDNNQTGDFFYNGDGLNSDDPISQTDYPPNHFGGSLDQLPVPNEALEPDTSRYSIPNLERRKSYNRSPRKNIENMSMSQSPVKQQVEFDPNQYMKKKFHHENQSQNPSMSARHSMSQHIRPPDLNHNIKIKKSIESHLLYEINQEKIMIAQKSLKKQSEQDEIAGAPVNMAKINDPEVYFDKVSYNIPIGELYKLVLIVNHSEQNEFCAVVLMITHMELQQHYEGRYLLQVWTKRGELIFMDTFQRNPHLVNLNGEYLTYVQNEKEPTDHRQYRKVTIIKLSKNPKVPCKIGLFKTQQFWFYQNGKFEQDELDQFLAFTDDYLIVASRYVLNYVFVHEAHFVQIEVVGLQKRDREKLKTHTLLPPQEIEFKQGVRILDIIEVTDGKPCLITENHQGCLSFIEMSIKDKKTTGRSGHFDNIIHFAEISPGITDTDAKNDPVVEIRNQMFLVQETNEYKHCGLARRESGSLEFIWNFRIVETSRVVDPLIDGFIDMINCDFDFMYYRKVFLDLEDLNQEEKPSKFSKCKQSIKKYCCKGDLTQEMSRLEILKEELKDQTSEKYNRIASIFTKNADFLNQQNLKKNEQSHELIIENTINDELDKLSVEFGCKITIKVELLRCANQWKERLGSNTSSVFKHGRHDIQKAMESILDRRSSNYLRLYPWFSNMSSHFTIVHYNYLSIFDINSQQWKHSHFDRTRTPEESHRFPDLIKDGFRIQDEVSKYWAGIVLDSDRVTFMDPKTGLQAETEMEDIKLPAGDQILKVIKDINLQRFVLFLVKCREQQPKDTSAIKSTVNQTIYKVGKSKQDQNLKGAHLSLLIYTGSLKKPNPLNEVESYLDESSNIYVIPSQNKDESQENATIIIDQTKLTKNQKQKNPNLPPPPYFFKLQGLSGQAKPKVIDLNIHKNRQDKGSKQNQLQRPVNLSYEKQDSQNNDIAGYLDFNCRDGQKSNIFVTRSDISVCKMDRQKEEIQEVYKHFCGRHIQAILKLDGWMYTLSNPAFPVSHKDQNNQCDCTPKHLDGKKDETASDEQEDCSSPMYLDKKKTSASLETNLTIDGRQVSIHDKNKSEQDKGRVKKAEPFTGGLKDNSGLFVYDLQRMANELDLVLYRLKDAIVGVNRYIDFCHISQRISFLKDFSNIEMVPVPHRNTINFLGMRPKDQYLIWREVNGIFTALDNGETGTPLLRAWEIGTGKTTKPTVTVGNIDLEGYSLYECNDYDMTFKKNWQQKPSQSVALLKHTSKLQCYPKESQSILDENQNVEFNDVSKCQNEERYMFKVLTMSDEVVNEEFTFTFRFMCSPPVSNSENLSDKNDGKSEELLQRLNISEDLTKLMECFVDSRCSIYTKSSIVGKKKIEWLLTHQIKKYPTILQGLTYANFLFSPNFNYYIDVAVDTKEFCICAVETNQPIMYIPKGLYKVDLENQDQGMKELAARMLFETEDTLRIIDRFGFDAVVQLNYSTPENPVSIKSVCKIDHWDEDEKHNHAILDMKSISNIDTLARLVRMNQKFKVRQYHLKEELAQEYSVSHDIIKRKPTDTYKVSCDGQFHQDSDMQKLYSDKLHHQMQTVDYSQPWSNPESQFVAEMAFTILDWQIIERIVSGQDTNFSMNSIDDSRILQLCFNIFPGVKTVFHKCVENENQEKNIKQVFNTCKKRQSKIGKIKVYAPVLEDVNGNTALDIVFEKGKNSDTNLANTLLTGMKDYPFLSCGFVLVSGVIKAFEYKCPAIGEFLEKRFVQSKHLQTDNELKRKALNKANRDYFLDHNGQEIGMMLADAWQDKEVLNNHMFESGRLAKQIELVYFDIPSLHTFNNDGCRFFELLSSPRCDIQIFGTKAVQMVITHKWEKVWRIVVFMQFIPHLVLILIHLAWIAMVRPYRQEMEVINGLNVGLLFILIVYFAGIEIMQIQADHKGYKENIQWNLSEIIPICGLMTSCVNSIRESDSKEIHWLTVIWETITIVMLWFKLFAFLRIFKYTNRYARMVIEVCREMVNFTLIFLIGHLAFGQVFFYLNQMSREDFVVNGEVILEGHQFTDTYMSSVFFVWHSSIGEYGYEKWGRDNKLGWLCWSILIISLVVNAVVMLNLLIAIVDDVYQRINDLKIEYSYRERAVAIADVQRILPTGWVDDAQNDSQTRISCQKVLLIARQDMSEQNQKGKQEEAQFHKEQQLGKFEEILQGVRELKLQVKFQDQYDDAKRQLNSKVGAIMSQGKGKGFANMVASIHPHTIVEQEDEASQGSQTQRRERATPIVDVEQLENMSSHPSADSFN